MYQQDLDVGTHDADTTFLLALHHLLLASALFDRMSIEEFAEARTRAEIPDVAVALVAAVAADKELEAWLQDHKEHAGREMAAYGEDDPAIEPIWNRYADELRERLIAAGWSENVVDFELGDMAAVLKEFRDGDGEHEEARP